MGDICGDREEPLWRSDVIEVLGSPEDVYRRPVVVNDVTAWIAEMGWVAVVVGLVVVLAVLLLIISAAWMWLRSRS